MLTPPPFLPPTWKFIQTKWALRHQWLLAEGLANRGSSSSVVGGAGAGSANPSASSQIGVVDPQRKEAPPTKNPAMLLAEAEKAFWKATWCDSWFSSAHLCLAQLALCSWHEPDFDCRALLLARDHLRKVLSRNANNHRARHLEVIILKIQLTSVRLRKRTPINSASGGEEEGRGRCSGDFNTGNSVVDQDFLLERKLRAKMEESLALDPTNFGVLFEKGLLNRATGEKMEGDDYFAKSLLPPTSSFVLFEYVLEYVWCRLFDEALQLLALVIDSCSAEVAAAERTAAASNQTGGSLRGENLRPISHTITYLGYKFCE